jgi:hypothetical protein
MQQKERAGLARFCWQNDFCWWNNLLSCYANCVESLNQNCAVKYQARINFVQPDKLDWKLLSLTHAVAVTSNQICTARAEQCRGTRVSGHLRQTCTVTLSASRFKFNPLRPFLTLYTLCCCAFTNLRIARVSLDVIHLEIKCRRTHRSLIDVRQLVIMMRVFLEVNKRL